MPELPEVQTVVNDLNRAGLCGAEIVDVQIRWPRTIATGSAPAFRHQICGSVIERIFRRAKYIVFELSKGLYWLVHLRMTGRFEISSTGEYRRTHARATIDLKDGRCLIFHDTRKFGRFYVTSKPESILGKLGPEPLSSKFSAKLLAGRINRRRGLIKPLLLNQKFIAGLGNIYVDEALWAARIHPMRRACDLTEHEIRVLHRSIRHVLRQAVENAGTALGSGLTNFQSVGGQRAGNAANLKVFRRTGRSCPRCGSSIIRNVVMQRSTHLCPQCQRIE